jgi:hypothetical protein
MECSGLPVVSNGTAIPETLDDFIGSFCCVGLVVRARAHTHTHKSDGSNYENGFGSFFKIRIHRVWGQVVWPSNVVGSRYHGCFWGCRPMFP